MQHAVEICKGEQIYHERIAMKYKMLKFGYLCGVLHTLEIASTVWCTRHSSSPRYDTHRGDHFVIEYLSENATEIENTLGYLSGAQMGSNHEINTVGVENLVTHSLLKTRLYEASE